MNRWRDLSSPPPDEAIDGLLRDFFAAELPADLPLPPDPTHPVELRGPAMAGAAARRSANWMLAAVACGLAVAVALLPPLPSPEAPPDPPLVAQVPQAAPPLPAQVRYATGTGPTAVRMIDTEDGPLEQRTTLIWTTVTVVEPETGAEIEWTAPALAVELVRRIPQ